MANQDTEQLQKLRDELKLQAHLFSMEVKDEWHELEQKWDKVNQELQPLEQATSTSLNEISAAAKLLMEEIKNGYERIKSSL